MRLALSFQRVDPTRGGAETYVADLCRRLIHAGHSLDLYAENWRQESLPDGLNCHKVHAPGFTKWQRTWNFAREAEAALGRATTPYDCTIGLINTWAQDVLIPQGGVHGASLEYNSRRFRQGLSRTGYVLGKKINPKAWVYHAIEAKQYAPARNTRIVAVSKMVRSHLERFHGVPASRVHVIPNAIDADRLSVGDPGEVRRQFRARHGLGEDELVGLFVGHNFQLKGLRPLIHALAERKRRIPNARPVRLLVCGGGKPGPFRVMVRDLRLEDTVHILGFQGDIRPCFHASDFFTLPSYYDPCSLVVFEALACGLPVITTACNGAGELIEAGRQGFVVPSPDAIDPLIGAIEAMAHDSSRHAMSLEAVKLGREQSFDLHVRRLLDVFQLVADEKRGRTITGAA